MDEKKKLIEEQISQLITGIGATAEFLGIMRSSLIKNGFTREEAVGLCGAALVAIISPKKEKN